MYHGGEIPCYANFYNFRQSVYCVNLGVKVSFFLHQLVHKCPSNTSATVYIRCNYLQATSGQRTIQCATSGCGPRLVSLGVSLGATHFQFSFLISVIVFPIISICITIATGPEKVIRYCTQANSIFVYGGMPVADG